MSVMRGMVDDIRWLPVLLAVIEIVVVIVVMSRA